MTIQIEQLYWHDGNLVELAFTLDSAGHSSVLLKLQLYPEGPATKRSDYQLRCSGISRYHCTLDVAELAINQRFGHIANGYLKQNTLWLYFTDGVLEICAEEFQLSHGND